MVRALLLTAVLLCFNTGCRSVEPPLQRAYPDDLAQRTPEVSQRPSGMWNADTPVSTLANTVAVPGSDSIPETPPDPWETPMPVTQPITITIVFDNHTYVLGLKTAWGFSALIDNNDHVLLFDTGGDGPMLLDNMNVLGIDPTRIESVVLSHAHGDHTGGLSALLEVGARPEVYLLPSFPASFRKQVGRLVEVIEVTEGMKVAENLYTTGTLGRSIPEQALVIRTSEGLVVVTGCAHPGIVEILEQVQETFNDKIHLALGGFHLGSKSRAEIESILKAFRRLGVELVAPCHCTGDTAIAMFAEEYGDDFIQTGVGQTFRLEIAVSQ